MVRKKYLVIGAMYSLNFGDGIICEVVKKIVEDDNENIVQIMGISGKDKFPKVEINKNRKLNIKNKISKILPIKMYITIRSKKNLRKKILELNAKEYEAIIFAGGQLFMDCFINYIREFICWAKKNNIPVIFNCCGLGHLSLYNRIKLRNCLKKDIVKSITLRDGVDKFNKYIKIKKPTKKIYDPVVELSKYYKRERYNKFDVGIGIIHPVNFRKNCVKIDEKQYYNIIKKIIDKCKKDNKTFMLFTNGDLMDQQYCEELAVKLKCIDNVLDRPKVPTDLINNILLFKTIISCRLHSLIIASSYDIPVACLVWDLKVKEYMQNIDRDKYCILLDKEPSFEDISKVLNQLFVSKEVNYYTKYDLSSYSICENLKIIIENGE